MGTPISETARAPPSAGPSFTDRFTSRRPILDGSAPPDRVVRHTARTHSGTRSTNNTTRNRGVNHGHPWVVAAVYGALVDGDPDKDSAYNVTEILQHPLDTSQTDEVTIDNTTFGDPAPPNTKHFGALVLVDGEPVAFACQEGQTIDFT